MWRVTAMPEEGNLGLRTCLERALVPTLGVRHNPAAAMVVDFPIEPVLAVSYSDHSFRKVSISHTADIHIL